MKQRILINKAKSESIHNTVSECTVSGQYSSIRYRARSIPKNLSSPETNLSLDTKKTDSTPRFLKDFGTGDAKAFNLPLKRLAVVWQLRTDNC